MIMGLGSGLLALGSHALGLGSGLLALVPWILALGSCIHISLSIYTYTDILMLTYIYINIYIYISRNMEKQCKQIIKNKWAKYIPVKKLLNEISRRACGLCV